MEDPHEKLKKELKEKNDRLKEVLKEAEEHQVKTDEKMDKQIDNTPVLAIFVTGWLITIMILMLIDPELTKNEFFALWLVTSTIIGLLRHIFKQS